MPSFPDFEPHLLGPYFLLEALAYGDTARVFRARALGAAGFQREVVVKRMLPALAGNTDFLEMLVHEAKLTSVLQHGNIAQVNELGLVDGHLFLAMEYVEGVTYGELLRAMRSSGPAPSIAEVCHIISEASAGLDYAHRKTDPSGAPLGIVHCDVSPENLVISFEGVVKLLDFGLARVAARFGGPGSGKIPGAYAAPEQIEGGPVDARADVYASAVLLYEGLSGVHPFGKDGDRRKPPRPLTDFDSEIPAKLDALVRRALSHDPEGRPPSSRHLASELDQFVGESALASAALSRSLRTLFAARIAERRAIRAGDDHVIEELQRQTALQTSPRLPRIDLPSPRPSRVGPLPLALAPLVLLLLPVVGLWLYRLSQPATAVVVADVAGARVRVDHTIEGPAPLVIRNMPPGVPRLIEVDAPGRTPYIETFAPGAGSITVIQARLAGSKGSVRVETDPPGAVLSVEGKVIGTTPTTIEDVQTGVPQHLRLELAGVPPQEFTKTFDQGQNEPLRIALPRPKP